MRFFLKRLVPSAARGRSRIRNSRRLSFERLDARRLLAVDVGESADEPVAYVAPAPVEAASQKSADSPLWGDTAKKAGGTTTMSSNNGYGGYGGYGFIAPEILDFTYTESTPGMYTFTGRVSDEEGVSGLIVEFGGVLAGESTMVQADGTFELIVLLDPNVSGTATAVVTDWDEIPSQMAETYVG